MFKSVLTALVIPLVLLGCSANDSIPDKPLSQRVTVTVSSGEDMPITRTTPLSWYSDVITVMDTEITEQSTSSSLKTYLKQSVQDNLQGKGFAFVEEGASSRYQLVVVAMLGDQEAASNVKQLFQLYPSLSGDSAKYPKGTILVGILDQQINRAVWRGATQAFTSSDLSEEERLERINHSVGGLLKNVKPGR
jgi:Domain of unknown function (DUF4136)